MRSQRLSPERSDGRRPGALILVATLLGACSGEPAPAPATDDPIVPGAVHQPQLVHGGDGVLLIWRRPVEGGSDLLAAGSPDGRRFGPPVRINDRAGEVADFDLDELRPSIAVGPAGLLAIAWGDPEGDVQAAISRDRGLSFEPSIRLNQDAGGALQSFPAIAFDPDGALHAVWLDTRASGTGDEEPADLYYARVRDGRAEEANLTADDAPSVCGCCRPGLEVDPTGRVSAAFRNVTADGFRDIFRVEGSLAEGFSVPRRLGPPTWKLSGCPMAGPLVAGPATLWNDASTGDRRTILAADLDAGPVVVADGQDVRPLAPPRRVEGDDALLLLPGDPGGRLLVRRASGLWEPLPGEVPRWATSALRLGDELILAGADGGGLQLTRRPVDQAPSSG